MFLAFLSIAIFLREIHADYTPCPTSSQIHPCKCESYYRTLRISCEKTLVDQIRGPLIAIAKSKVETLSLKLNHIQLSNLPSNLLMVCDVIEIRECNISTVDNNAFVNMAARLRTLYITGNPLKEVPSHALQMLSNLMSLGLDDNRIQVLRAGAFMGLDSLQVLTLGGNGINFIDDFAFGGMGSRMDNLDLSRNELTSVPGKPLSKLNSLRYLRMNDNKIASLVPEDFDAMGGEELSSLHLENNGIRHLPAGVFKSLKKLSKLYLSDNLIESIHTSEFEGNGDTLTALHLNYNRLREVPTESLKNLSKLIYINLSGNNICKVRKDDFLPYGKNLEWIFLYSNLLTYVDPSAFIHLDALKSLFLQYNQLTSATFDTYLPVIDTLERFKIHDNPLHCDCNLSWLRNWIHGKGSRVVQKVNETKCASPERYNNRLLAGIPPSELVCENSTSKIPEPCCNCVNSGQRRFYSDWFLTLFQLCATYSLTALAMNGLLKS